MWVNSKTAAAVFCVNHKSVEKSAFRATKQGKNFCSLKSHICNFMYSNGIGRGGKVLQIWIDDEIIAKFESENGVRVSINGISQGLGGANLQGRGGDFANLHNENLGGSVVSAGSVEVATGGDRNEVSKIEPFVHVKKFLDTSATSEAVRSNLLSSKKSTASQTQSVAVIGCETTSFMADGAKTPPALSFMSASQAQRDIAYAKKAIIDEWELNKKGLLVGASHGGKKGRGVAGNGEVVGNSLDCFVSCDTRNDNKSVVGGRGVGVSGLVGGRNDKESVSVGVENSKKKSKKIKITELENMRKIKAVNELRNHPRGFSKTLWGQNIAKKYGVSLKTLYAWAKKCDELEYKRGENQRSDGVSRGFLRSDSEAEQNTIDSTSDADTIFGENGESVGEFINLHGADNKNGVEFGNTDKFSSGNFSVNSAINDFGGSADINFRAIFKSSSFKICALEWAVGFMLTNPLVTKKRAYEELNKKAIKENWAIGSYKSFARLLDKKEIKAMLLRATAGDRGVRNEIAPFVKRDLNAYESMELVCGDQIVFDFNAISPDGSVVNPNAYVWVDMGSGAVIGVDVVFGKYNSQSVGRSLKMALKFGVADAIYTDNGKPELSKYIASLRSQLGDIAFRDFDELNPIMVHKKAKPGNSRAKPIENIFNHIQKWLRDEIIIARGGRGYHKQDRDKKELLKKYMKEKPLNYDEFIAFFECVVRQWNNHYNQSRKIVPINAFLEKLEARNIVKFDDTTLDFIFSVKKELRVRNSSVSFRVKNENFTYSHPILSKYHKELVEIRIDESDYESVGVFDIDTHDFICSANLVTMSDPRDEERIKAQIERNEAVVKAVKEAFKYYKDFYKKSNATSNYTATAHNAKMRTKIKEKAKNKILMSNEELTKILQAM